MIAERLPVGEVGGCVADGRCQTASSLPLGGRSRGDGGGSIAFPAAKVMEESPDPVPASSLR
jgi:hypothetical protein